VTRSGAFNVAKDKLQKKMLKSCIWPLAFGFLVHLKAQCMDGALDQDRTCKMPGGSDRTTDDVAEMHVELLQRDIKLSDGGAFRASKAASIAVQPWKCLDANGKNTSKAYQSTTANDNSWTRFQVLDMETGVYETQINLNLNLQPPGNRIRSLNSCAINPKDSILYCSLEVNNPGGSWIGSFLVRIDNENTIGFVTKLLGFRYAATFDNNDNYYVSGQNQMSVVTKVSEMIAYDSYDTLNNYYDQAILGEQAVELVINSEPTTNYELGADFGTLDLPLEGATKKPYLISLKDTTLMVVRISPGEPYELWTLSTNLGGVGTPNVWGAAWKWGKENSLYFAQDSGEGLYRLVSNTLDLTTKTATLKKVALANPTTWNDGFSCGDRTPFTPTKDEYPCRHELYQSTTVPYNMAASTSSNTYIRHMTHAGSGTFEIDFEVVPNQYADEMQSMNACAVNPIDRMLYCQMQMTQGNRIARVDSSEVGFVQQSPGWCFAGIFDEKGTYWLYSNNGLFSVAGLDKEQGWYSYKVYEVANNKEWTHYPGFSQQEVGPSGAIGADMVTYGKSGKTYLVSIVESADNKISVVDITDTPKIVEGADGGKFWTAEGLPDPLPGNTTNTWGSAWKTAEGKIWFARDFEGQLYELEKVDFSTKTASFTQTGKTEVAYWHDGFSCIENITGIDDR